MYKKFGLNALLVTVLLAILTLGIPSNGFATGNQPPPAQPGYKSVKVPLKSPKIGGTLTAVWKYTDQIITAVVVANCKGFSFVAGPLFQIDMGEVDFDALTGESELPGLDLETLAPIECFGIGPDFDRGEDGLIIESVLKHTVEESKVETIFIGKVVIAEVVIAGYNWGDEEPCAEEDIGKVGEYDDGLYNCPSPSP